MPINAPFWQIMASIIISLLGAGWMTQWVKNRGDGGMKRQDEIALIRKDQREDIDKLNARIDLQEKEHKAEIKVLHGEVDALHNHLNEAKSESARLKLDVAKERQERELQVKEILFEQKAFARRVLFFLQHEQNDPAARRRLEQDVLMLLQQAQRPVAHRILVVDDSIDTAQVVGLMLRAAGWESEMAHSGGDALLQIESAKRQSKPFDLILLDYQMPNMDGCEVLRHIREREAATPGARPVEVAFFTGGAESVPDEIRSAPHTRVWTKGTDVEKLPALVREALASAG